jgi:ABC-type spermidine/putrescine transport system permease subunit I
MLIFILLWAVLSCFILIIVLDNRKSVYFKVIIGEYRDILTWRFLLTYIITLPISTLVTCAFLVVGVPTLTIEFLYKQSCKWWE